MIPTHLPLLHVLTIVLNVSQTTEHKKFNLVEKERNTQLYQNHKVFSIKNFLKYRLVTIQTFSLWLYVMPTKIWVCIR